MMKQSRLALKIQLLRYLKQETSINYDLLEQKLAQLRQIQGPNPQLFNKFHSFVHQNKAGLKMMDQDEKQSKFVREIEYVDDRQLEKDEYDSDWSVENSDTEEKEEVDNVLVPVKSNVEHNKRESRQNREEKQKIGLKTPSVVCKKGSKTVVCKQPGKDIRKKGTCKH